MITPRFDPTGDSWLHKANPFSKLVWLGSVGCSSFLSSQLAVLGGVLLECVLLYGVIIHHKRTPAPPLLSLVITTSILITTLNYLFWGSAIGSIGPVSHLSMPIFSARVDYSLSRGFGIATTMLSLFCLLLSTYPRELARSFEKAHVNRRFCEPLAIALRFLLVFEVAIKVQSRIARMRGHAYQSPKLRLRAFIILALSQANITEKSLKIYGFDPLRRKHDYSALSLSFGDMVLLALSVLHLTVTI